MEPGVKKGQLLLKWQPQFAELFKRLTIAQPGDVPPGDIVVWSHPSGPLMLTWGMKPHHLLGYGKDDAWLIIQSDQIDRVITPFQTDPALTRDFTVLFEASVSASQYFIPSLQVPLHRLSQLLIMQRVGPTTNGGLVQYQQRMPLWRAWWAIVQEAVVGYFKGFSVR